MLIWEQAVFVFPLAGWQRALLVVPLMLAIVLTTPGWLFWLFLPASQRADFLALNGKLIDWAKVIAGSPPPPPPQIEDKDATDDRASWP